MYFKKEKKSSIIFMFVSPLNSLLKKRLATFLVEQLSANCLNYSWSCLHSLCFNVLGKGVDSLIFALCPITGYFDKCLVISMPWRLNKRVGEWPFKTFSENNFTPLSPAFNCIITYNACLQKSSLYHTVIYENFLLFEIL